ncbi:MAG: MerR family transcriptional regulator [Gemmatimonadales bacterium]|jgi:DNA-binding transcriptional MerR regulator
MTDQPLSTLRDIARELGIPESTVRYYRDAFNSHIATVGTGRRRRYPPEAVAVLRSIKRGYGSGKSREEIEAELSGVHVQQSGKGRPRARGSSREADAQELLSTILDGERERREAMWQMAREIVRLGQAVERQQEVLGEIAEQLTRQADRALPAGSAPREGAAETAPASEPAARQPPDARPVAPAAPSGSAQPPHAGEDLARQLAGLEEELTRERDLVERLRKSKLEIERRAASAEARLDEGDDDEPRDRRSLFGRFLGRRSEANQEDG